MKVDEAAATRLSKRNLEEITKEFQKLYDSNCKRLGLKLTNSQNTFIFLQSMVSRSIKNPNQLIHIT